MVPQNDLFSEARLRSALGTRPFRFEPRVESLAGTAEKWAEEGGPDGAVVLAEEEMEAEVSQKTGRWITSPGEGLLIGMILRQQPYLISERGGVTTLRMSMNGAAAVIDALTELTSESLSLKWPNKVLLNGRKVASVVTYNVWHWETRFAMLLTIRLNARGSFVGTPLADRAVAVEQVTGGPVDRLALLTRILDRVDYWLLRTQEAVPFERWDAWWSDIIGRRVSVRLGKDIYRGPVLEVEQRRGMLVIAADKGKLYLDAAVVTYDGDDGIPPG